MGLVDFAIFWFITLHAVVNHLGFKDVRSLEGGMTAYVEIDKSVYHRRMADEKIEEF